LNIACSATILAAHVKPAVLPLFHFYHSTPQGGLKARQHAIDKQAETRPKAGFFMYGL